MMGVFGAMAVGDDFKNVVTVLWDLLREGVTF
jgi:hypothetical protein